MHPKNKMYPEKRTPAKGKNIVRPHNADRMIGINILPSGKINGKINSTLDILKYNPTATIPDLVEVTGNSQRSISRELREYQDAGLLEREGARKNGRWIVK